MINPPGSDQYFEVSGGCGSQGLFLFVETYLENLEFNHEGLGNLYKAYNGIVMDPARRFGEPLLEKSGYTAKVIWDSIRIEGGIDRAASAYGIPRDEAEAAYKFFVDHLGKAE